MAEDKKSSIGKDLTVSGVDRQNILNNPFALQEIEKAAHIRGIPFEGKSVVLKEQVAAFFEVTPRTVDNYIEKNGEELRQNGYEVIRGKRLKELKLRIHENGVHETDFVNIKTPQIGVFDFRAFLNLAMLMTESEAARLLRQATLDKFHCFQDGNKRIAISLGAQFLLLNGYVFVASRFMREMENISYHVAAGRIDKELLKEVISAVIEDRVDDEKLKIKIFHAISREDKS